MPDSAQWVDVTEQHKAQAPGEGGWVDVTEQHLKGEAPSTLGDEAQTGLENYANSLTSGHLARLQAAVEPAQTKLMDLISGKSVYKDLPDYQSRVKENNTRINEETARNPNAAVAGKIGGALNQGILVGTALPKAPTNALGRIGNAALSGGAIGASQNPGDNLDTTESLKSRGIGGLAGLLTGGALQGVGEAASAGLKGLRSGADATKRVLTNAKPDTDTAINAALGDARVKVNPADYVKDAETMRVLKSDPSFYKNNAYSSIPNQSEIGAQEFNQARKALDAQLKYSQRSGATPQSQDEIKYMADKARGVLHDVSPEANMAYRDAASQIRSQQGIDAAKKALAMGDSTAVAKLAGIPLVEALKGGVRSLVTPANSSPAGAATRNALVDLLLQNNSSRNE